MNLIQEGILTCYHCGEECQEEKLSFDDKMFCCHGCRAVFELIESSNLQQYYQNDELKAEKVLDKQAAERQFSFLELPEVVKGLLSYQDEQKSLVRFYLAGIHCSSCIYLLEHLSKFNGHILKVEVNFIRKEVAITFDHHQINLKQIAVLLSSLGYAPTVNLNSLDKPEKHLDNSSLGMKIAVAGFCFGNSMLISLPEYLDVGFQLESTFKSLFGWINLLLAIPVVFYAASDYFISSWKGIKHGYPNIDVPVSLGIITLFFRSAFEIIYGISPGYVDSLTGFIFFLLVGKWYQGKTYQALSFERDYTSYFPISVMRLQGGNEEPVMIKELKAGDRIIVHNHELIPADGMIESGEGKLDYSFVTGESEPLHKQKGDKIFAGGRQIGGQLIVQLEKAVNSSDLTQLWNNQSFAKERQNQYVGLVDEVSKYFTAFVVLLAIGTGIYWWNVAPEKVWDSVTAVLIVACACALALILPFAFGHAMRVLGSKGVYLKNANVIETIARIKEVVFDKTGTLTKNDPLRINYHGEVLDSHDLALLRTATSNSAHPLSKLVAAHIGNAVEKLPITHFNEVIGKGVEARIGSDLLKCGSADWLNVSAEKKLHESQVHVFINDMYKGYFAIKAEYREGVFEELLALRKGYKLHLLSGDNETEKDNLKPYFDHLAFNQRPAQKLEYIESIKGTKLMIGDGLNDAGALKSADAGFAVCEDIHQFSPACDAMLEARSIQLVPNILKFSKGVMVIVVLGFIISFSYNIIGLSFAVSGNLTPLVSAILMPLSSVTVVGFITLAINVMARRTMG